MKVGIAVKHVNDWDCGEKRDGFGLQGKCEGMGLE